MSDSENKVKNILFVILAGTVLAEAHGIKIVAKEDVLVEVGTESYDMAAEVLVGAGRQDLLPRLEHFETANDEELGVRQVNVRYNPIGQRMIQEKEHAKAEAEAIAEQNAPPVVVDDPASEEAKQAEVDARIKAANAANGTPNIPEADKLPEIIVS